MDAATHQAIEQVNAGLTAIQVTGLAASICGVLVGALALLFLKYERQGRRHNVEVKDLYKQFIDEKTDTIKKLTDMANDSKNAIAHLDQTLDTNNDLVRELIKKI